MMRGIPCELQIARIQGACEGNVVRITADTGGKRVIIELPLLDYAKATMGELVHALVTEKQR